MPGIAIVGRAVHPVYYTHLDVYKRQGLLRAVRPLLAAMDVGFVLSSRLDTISFACREMMAAGRPVIVSDTGGLAENVTEGGNGWIVPVSAPPRVAETLAEILENRILLDWMAAAARRRAVRDFSLEAFRCV